MRNTTGSVHLRRWTFALFASAAALALTVGEGDAASLKETVTQALATNPELDIVKTDRRAVDQELRQARAARLPSIDLRGAAGPEWSDNNTTRANPDSDNTRFRTEAQLSLSQMLFDGFATDSEIERQIARIDSAAYRVEEAAEFIAVNAIEAHLDILRNQEIVRLNEANIAQHERILGQVRDLESAGRGDIADVRQAEARLARAFDTLAVARGSLADAIARYQRVVGARPGELEDGEVPVEVVPASSEVAAGLASVDSPTVQIAAADVDVAAAELRAARAGFYPRVDLELGSSVNRNIDGASGRDNDVTGLVVMRYNLYRGGADMALEREAFHRANESRASLAKARRLAEEEARLSYNALETAKARTEALGAKAEAQRRTRDAYAQQFEIGQRQLLDLLDGENELFLDRVALTTAVYTERFAAFRLLAVVGALLEHLDVAPPRDAITIHRSVNDLQTPEAIEEKSDQVDDPRAEPRPLRGVERGEPPVEALDMAPLIGGVGGADGMAAAEPVEPATDDAETPGVAGLAAELQENPSAASVEVTDSNGKSFTVGRDAAAVAPASYDSWGAFVDHLFGGEGGDGDR